MKHFLALCFASCSLLTTGQVCLEIKDSPFPDEPSLTLLSKYINVFGIGIYGESSMSDEDVLHVAAVFAELLDNDEDGRVDDPLVLQNLLERKVIMPVFKEEGSDGEMAFWDNYNFDLYLTSAVVYERDIARERPLTSNFDATIEENLHSISALGYAFAYPEAFSEFENSGSRLTAAMDVARGGHFTEVPDEYPEAAWYHYDDETCNYECMATEYFYWGLTSLMGLQDYGDRCEKIEIEWEPCTAEQFSNTDLLLHDLFTDPQFVFPLRIPDGQYCADIEMPEEPLRTGSKQSPEPFIYPNPVSDVIRLQLSFLGQQEVRVYSISGQEMLHTSYSDQSVIEVSHLSKGVYLLTVGEVSEMFFKD